MAPRRLLARLRAVLAQSSAPLAAIVRLVAAELVCEVCSIYALRPGDLVELVATEGLNPAAVGRTRLRVGEGIIGLCVATGTVLNLPDAQNHPAFAWRPETGEEAFAAMLAVPVRRAGRTLGAVAVQNRAARFYAEDEVETLETVAMVLAEALASAGALEAAEEGLAATLPRRFAGMSLVSGIAVGPVVLHGTRRMPRRLLAEDAAVEQLRLDHAVRIVQHRLDALIAASAAETREVLETYRLVAADAGWLRRVAEAVQSGLTAEAAVHRVADELHDGMRRIIDS